MNNFLQQIKRVVNDHLFFQRGEKVMVCVSGGADSMALLTALHELSPELKVRLLTAHFNHQLRSRSSDEDERFVRDAAARLNVEFVAGRGNVKRIARQNGESLEMAGRRARYDFFSKIARSHSCSVAATAHTADDQAETLLLRLSRGTSLRGLRGIPRSTVWKRLKIVRPFRDVKRSDIIHFLKTRKMIWREDESNLDTKFLRNRVRHEIIPFLESTLNPEIKQALLRLANIIEEENEWMEILASKILVECGETDSKNTISHAKLSANPVAARRRALRLWLTTLNVPHELLDFQTTERIDKLLTSGRTGKIVTIAENRLVRRENDLLRLIEKNEENICVDYNVKIAVPGETIVNDLKIITRIAPGIARDKTACIGSFPAQASFSVATWRRRSIRVRSWMPGDKISPIGMKGAKKLHDIFVDSKTPKSLRHTIPLFECGRDIIWLPGYRVNRAWAVPDEVVRALQIRVEKI